MLKKVGCATVGESKGHDVAHCREEKRGKNRKERVAVVVGQDHHSTTTVMVIKWCAVGRYLGIRNNPSRLGSLTSALASRHKSSKASYDWTRRVLSGVGMRFWTLSVADDEQSVSWNLRQSSVHRWRRGCSPCLSGTFPDRASL